MQFIHSCSYHWFGCQREFCDERCGRSPKQNPNSGRLQPDMRLCRVTVAVRQRHKQWPEVETDGQDHGFYAEIRQQ